MTDKKDDPKFTPFDLKEFLESGALLAVNERVLWPLGLALTVNMDTDTGAVSDLHVRQWVFADGHHEIIEDSAPDDPVIVERHAALKAWVEARAASMTVPGEADIALRILIGDKL